MHAHTHLPSSGVGLHHRGGALDPLVLLLLLQEERRGRQGPSATSLDSKIVCFLCFFWASPAYSVSAVPGRHHDLALLQQQEVGAALPAAVDLLDERGQVLQALLPPVLQEEELQVGWGGGGGGGKQGRPCEATEGTRRKCASLSCSYFFLYTFECRHRPHSSGGKLHWKKHCPIMSFLLLLQRQMKKRERKKSPLRSSKAPCCRHYSPRNKRRNFPHKGKRAGPSWGAETSREIVLHGRRPRVTVVQMD